MCIFIKAESTSSIYPGTNSQPPPPTLPPPLLFPGHGGDTQECRGVGTFYQHQGNHLFTVVRVTAWKRDGLWRLREHFRFCIKGQCHDIFSPYFFFALSTLSGPLINRLKQLCCELFCSCEDIYLIAKF